MALSYLYLTNEVLKQVNEVNLTAGNFSEAGGAHAAVKSAVNYAIRDINRIEFEWPFNHTTQTQTLTVGTYKYTLPSDCKVVDWHSFYITPDSDKGIDGGPLKFEDYEFWMKFRRLSDDQPSGTEREPEIVVPTQDAASFIVSPVPSEAFEITFEYFKEPPKLVNANDETTIPDRFEDIIISRALQWVYYFRENYEQARLFDQDYKDQIGNMRSQLMNKYTRVRTTYVNDR